jgi:hypothetical protein
LRPEYAQTHIHHFGTIAAFAHPKACENAANPIHPAMAPRRDLRIASSTRLATTMNIKSFVIASLSFGLLSACADMQTASAPVQVSRPATSYAATECGRTFAVDGDPRNGATYAASVKLPDLDTRSAIGQMEKIALDQGMQIGADQVDNGSGKVTIIVKDPNGGHDYPMMAAAQKSSGRVTLLAQLNRDQIIDHDVMRDRMCDMLSKVRMDAAGASVAASMQAKNGSGKITDVKALDLAQEVAEALRQKEDATDVTMKYAGRIYRIDGQVSRPNTGMGMYNEMQIAGPTKSFSIPYITEVHAGLLGIGPMQQTRVQIVCRTAPDQFARFAKLRDKDYATLIAKVVNFRGQGRPNSLIADNPLTTTGPLIKDQSYGGTLNMDCEFER